MGLHTCFTRDGHAIPCLCDTNRDHHEEEFAFGQEPEDDLAEFEGDANPDFALGDPELGEEDE